MDDVVVVDVHQHSNGLSDDQRHPHGGVAIVSIQVAAHEPRQRNLRIQIQTLLVAVLTGAQTGVFTWVIIPMKAQSRNIFRGTLTRYWRTGERRQSGTSAGTVLQIQSLITSTCVHVSVYCHRHHTDSCVTPKTKEKASPHGRRRRAERQTSEPQTCWSLSLTLVYRSVFKQIRDHTFMSQQLCFSDPIRRSFLTSDTTYEPECSSWPRNTSRSPSSYKQAQIYPTV